MKTIVIDCETTVQRIDGVIDNSPFHPKNRLVSAHWQMMEGTEFVGHPQESVFYHKEMLVPDCPEKLRAALREADLLVAHNAKFDIMALQGSGFVMPEKCYCTMIGEYVLDRGQMIPKSLAKTAERRGVSLKKSDLVDAQFKSGVGFEEIALETVIEYADADVKSCAEIYVDQCKDFDKPENQGLKPTLELMNEFLLFLVHMEENGIHIDVDKLAQVKEDYIKEKKSIEIRLENIAAKVMGDTPINLSSGQDMSTVIYSRDLVNKGEHKQIFNLGYNSRGRPLYRPKMSDTAFVKAIRRTTKVAKKTRAEHCHTCKGQGQYIKLKKDGQPYKKATKCALCDGRGYLLVQTKETAGFGMIPAGVKDVCINGFSTSKTTIKRLIGEAKKQGKDDAVEFLEGFTRLNAISTYLDSFVNGIETWTREDGLLHAQFNQCRTKTGRLSSSNPNFQNQPKGGKFPVRGCVTSRFDDGIIIEADFSGLEFRVAGDLSGDPQIIKDILEGKDVHRQTASIIYRKPADRVTKEERQAAKAYTFAPLYGGLGMGEAPHIKSYFDAYFDIYKGLKSWHDELITGVLKDTLVTIPSGRQFRFPDVKRFKNGSVSNSTQIKNFPVQSFATADIVPLSCVRAYRDFRKKNLRSKIILTVHDSIVVDCAPEEKEEVIKSLHWAMYDVGDEIVSRYKYAFGLPLDIEIQGGKDWLEQEVYDIAHLG